MSGFILIDKPAGITSHDVVDRLRRITGIRKIGHAGTLDPFATGLLIVGIEREATRELGSLLGLDKTYEATATLGAVSDTQDLTGKILETHEAVMPDKTRIDDVLKKFTGEIDQIPPMYSAKKIKGKKLYELAREGKEVERKPVAVTIYASKLVKYEPPELSFRTSCSSGTYIRTLAHDIGQELGTGAYLTVLRRTAIGPFNVADAKDMESLSPENWQNSLIPVSEFPRNIAD